MLAESVQVTVRLVAVGVVTWRLLRLGANEEITHEHAQIMLEESVRN
jgi:hypothetical protein